MSSMISATDLGFIFIGCSILALGSYLRILVHLRFLDAGQENPPDRSRLSEKLIGYRDDCRERRRHPVLLILFAIGVIGAFISWIPLPWLIFRIP